MTPDQTCENERTADVYTAIGECENDMNVLEKRIEELITRLVVVSINDTEQETGIKDKTSSCKVSGDIRDLALRISKQVLKIEHQISILEI